MTKLVGILKGAASLVGSQISRVIHEDGDLLDDELVQIFSTNPKLKEEFLQKIETLEGNTEVKIEDINGVKVILFVEEETDKSVDSEILSN